MSIINKQLPEDPQYMVDARGLYNKECISAAKEILKKAVSNGRWSNRQVQSYEAVKKILIRFGQERKTEIEIFKKSHPDEGPQSIYKVLGVLLWDIIDQDSDDWKWCKDDSHRYCKVYSLQLS
jgi:hypothetical protein